MSAVYEVPTSLKQYLDHHNAHYKIIPHQRDYSAQRTAADTFTPGRQFAKCVMLWIDNYYAMAVLPADHLIDFEQLRETLEASEAGLVSEAEMRRLFPDCETGAEPPFGNLYDVPVLVARQLADDDVITFNAGTHEEAIRMPFAEFESLVDPIIMDLAIRMR